MENIFLGGCVSCVCVQQHVCCAEWSEVVSSSTHEYAFFFYTLPPVPLLMKCYNITCIHSSVSMQCAHEEKHRGLNCLRDTFETDTFGDTFIFRMQSLFFSFEKMRYRCGRCVGSLAMLQWFCYRISLVWCGFLYPAIRTKIKTFCFPSLGFILLVLLLLFCLIIIQNPVFCLCFVMMMQRHGHPVQNKNKHHHHRW